MDTNYSIPNPLGEGTTLTAVVDRILVGLQALVIPVAVIMIMWAGYQFLTGGNNPSKITKGKEILKWTAIGLIIIFVGSGFIDLIKSILGATGTTP